MKWYDYFLLSKLPAVVKAKHLHQFELWAVAEGFIAYDDMNTARLQPERWNDLLTPLARNYTARVFEKGKG